MVSLDAPFDNKRKKGKEYAKKEGANSVNIKA
jgi:hypothetical protein